MGKYTKGAQQGGDAGQGDYKKYMDYEKYTKGQQAGGSGQGDYKKYMDYEKYTKGAQQKGGASYAKFNNMMNMTDGEAKKYEDKYMQGEDSKSSEDYHKYMDYQKYTKQGGDQKGGGFGGDYKKYMDYSKFMDHSGDDKDSTVIFA